MSTLSTRNATDNMITADTDRAKCFIWNNEFKTGTLLNASGAEATFALGTVLGRIAASGKLVPLTTAAEDGSAFPVGVLAQTVTLGIAGEDTVTFAISGDVNESMIILDGADTLATVIALRTIGDRLMSDTKGIRTVVVTDSTFNDN